MPNYFKLLYVISVYYQIYFVIYFFLQRPNPKYDDSESSDSDSEIRPRSPKKKKKTLPTLPTLPALPPLPIPPSPAKANGQNSKSQDLISSGNFKARTSGQSMKLISLMILIKSNESDNFQKIIFKFLFLEFELKGIEH